MDYTKFVVSNQREESNSIHRVNTRSEVVWHCLCPASHAPLYTSVENCCEKTFRNTIRVSNSLAQIKPDVLSGLIWFQNVCKDYQQMTLGGKELIKPMVRIENNLFFRMFDLILYVPANNFSVMLGRVFLG